MLSFFQAIVTGLIQGVTELFPISSLGHTVVLPQILGWHSLVKAQSRSESYWLAFVVGLHVSTALALLAFFWREWVRIVKGLVSSARRRRIETADERLGWLLVVATIPAGLTGLGLEHVFRTIFAKPLAASLFLIVNGLILLVGERARRVSETREARLARHGAPLPSEGSASPAPGAAGTWVHAAFDQPAGATRSRALATLDVKEAVVIGVAQVFALFAGISRSGITMVAGLMRGMNYEDAARFSFLLATPIIMAAGVYKVPDLMGHLGNGIRGQVIAGSVAAFLAALGSVKFLSRYFESRNLRPFAFYCLGAGVVLTVVFAV